jgi:L-iditol 2-dehydrogenase
MKAAVIRKKGKINIENVPELPALKEYQCKCKNIYASACTGTDRKIINNKLPWGSNFPAILGHETVGEIIELGSKVANFAIGDVVLRPVYVYPGEQLNGFNAEFGGFSEFGIITDKVACETDGVPEENFNPYSKFQMKIPCAWRDRAEAVLLITMKETFSWINALGPLYGKKVAVIGTGTVGMFFIKFATLMCATEIVAAARSNTGAERAKQCGADNFVELGKGEVPEDKFDLVIDAAGVMDHINDFSSWVSAGGTYAVYGVSDSMETTINAFGSGINFAFHSPAEDDQLVHDTCVALVDKGLIDLKQFHSSVMDFEQLPEGFRKIDTKEEFKPIFTV